MDSVVKFDHTLQTSRDFGFFVFLTAIWLRDSHVWAHSQGDNLTNLIVITAF